MAIIFNPFTGNFDYTGTAASSQWKDPVTNQAALPGSGNTSGDVRVVLDTGIAYEWSGSSWTILNGVYPTTVSGTSTPDGVSVDGSNNLTLHVADATNPGLISTTTQTISGLKTFSSGIDLNNNSITNVADPSLAQDAATKNYTDITFIPLTQKAANNGVATLDSAGHVPLTQLPASLVEYKGTWAASTNTPTLADGTGISGWFYISSDSGTVDFGSGNITFNSGDWVLYNGSVWQRAVQSNIVQSVNGQTGIVTVNAINQLTGDITAGPASQSQSKAATVAAIQGTTVSGTTGTGNVVFSAAPTISGTAIFSSNISAPGMFFPSGPAISTQNGFMTDSSGVHKFDWINGNLTDTSNNTQLNWSTSGIEFNQLTASTVPYLSSGKVLTSSAVTPTELGYVSGVTSSIQTQLNNKASINTGDIAETSFSAANNQVSSVNVTGLAFANASVGSFRAQVQVYVNATTPLRQMFEINGSQIGASGWQINQVSAGDESGFTFTITSAGQIQYTSGSYTGFTAATVKFRAWAITL